MKPSKAGLVGFITENSHLMSYSSAELTVSVPKDQSNPTSSTVPVPPLIELSGSVSPLVLSIPEPSQLSNVREPHSSALVYKFFSSEHLSVVLLLTFIDFIRNRMILCQQEWDLSLKPSVPKQDFLVNVD